MDNAGEPRTRRKAAGNTDNTEGRERFWGFA